MEKRVEEEMNGRGARGNRGVKGGGGKGERAIMGEGRGRGGQLVKSLACHK